MTKAHRQEALCRAYVQAIAARCGVGCTVRTTDYGMDMTLHEISVRGLRRTESGCHIDVQAKSTTLADLEGEYVRYDLEAKTYEDLREPDVWIPRILVLLVLPNEESDWTRQSEEELTLHRCAYWMSFEGRESTGNRRSIRVAIPRTNLFSVAALQSLLGRVRRGETL